MGTILTVVLAWFAWNILAPILFVASVVGLMFFLMWLSDRNDERIEKRNQ